MKTFAILKTVTAGVLIGAVVACATATPYQPRDRGYGYNEQKLEANRYRVTFAGNSSTPRETVENYLLYRAAELTLETGNDYFVMASQGTEANTRYQQTITGYHGFGYYYWYPQVALAVSSSEPVTSYEAQAYIVMYKGGKPEGETKAFDARQLKTNLDPLVVRPEKK